MTHSKCGLLLLLAAGAVACGGDPTSSLQQTDEMIVATPSSAFVDEGASIFVIAERRDKQGNQLAAQFEPADVGSLITVVRDTTFLETTNGTVLNTRDRFVVTGLDQPGSTSFKITSAGLSLEIPVRVLPTVLAATFSNAAPAINEPMTITLPEGYTFGPTAAVQSNLGPGFVQSISSDGTSLSVVLIPGSVGPVTLSGVSFVNLPGVPISLPSVATVAAGTTPLAGTESPATAPSIPVPPLNGVVNFFDTGTFGNPDITGDGGVGTQYYKVTITEAGDYDFSLSWPGAADAPDMDAVLCFDTACSAGVFAGSGTTLPEEKKITLDPGTYYYSVVLFAGDPPPRIQITISHVPPTTGG